VNKIADSIKKTLEKIDSPSLKANLGNGISYKLIYDTPGGGLEPLYFWLLNFMGGKAEKLIDTFASSPGSGHFSELGLKKSQMQEQASRLMQTINTVLRSVLNLIYDLKEFQIRLSHYDAANSKDKFKKEAGMLALKQIWMDKVDMQRGQGAINALSSGNLQFVTLRDAFLKAKDEKDIKNIDLNDRVKRILLPRILEFNEWKERSHMELKKRFEIEKTYLKSQIDALKLQASWAKPYLTAAEKLAQDENLANDTALVTAFNTVLLQLTLMTKKEISVESETEKTRLTGRGLPESFKHMTKSLRKYYTILIINFKFTGIPNKIGQNFAFGGKAEINFESYALNKDELYLFEQELNKSDLHSALGLVQGMTDDSLSQLELDIEDFTKDGKDKKEKKSDPNPFTSLFSWSKSEDKTKELEKKNQKMLIEKGVKPDKYAEKYLRNLALSDANQSAFKIYDTFKKSLGLAAPPYKTGDPDESRGPPKSKADEFFGF